jgi:hypothetical protein
MCHENWWRERRNRRAEESQQIWQDFERAWPADAPEARDERPAQVRVDTEEQEPVPVER